MAKEGPNLGLDTASNVDQSLQMLLRARPGQDSELDVIAYLNEHFNTVESLDNVDSVIRSLDSQIQTIDDQLKEVMRD